MRFPLLFTLALAVCGLTSHSGAAQNGPANDQCQNATLLTNGLASSGTTVGAIDDIPGLVGCQSGPSGVGFPEVWYAFLATGPSVSYELQAPSPLDTVAVQIFSGSCGNLTLEASQCDAGSVVGARNGLVTGTTYYVAVSATSLGSFSLRVVTGATVVRPAQDCNRAVVLANLITINQGSLNSGGGFDLTEVSPANSCWGSGGERQPKWYRFTAGSTGPLEFSINPANAGDDYDWAVWDVTTEPNNCSMKGSAIACNWTGQVGATGMSLCPSLEPGFQGGDQFDNKTTGLTGATAPIMVQAGRVYALLVDNFSTSNVGFTLTFGGACGPPPQGSTPPATVGLGATFTAAVRPGLTMEFTPDVTIDSQLPVTYHWSFGDGATSTLRLPTHTYAAGGSYYTTLRVTDLLGTTVTYARVLTASITGQTDDVTRGARFELAPNPTRQSVRLTLPSPATPGVTVEFYNALGGLVRTTALQTRDITTDLDLTGLVPGVYAVRVGSDVCRLVVTD